MADDLRIIIKTQLDESSKQINSLNEQIKSISNKLNKIKLKVDIDQSGLKQIQAQVDKINNISTQSAKIKLLDQQEVDIYVQKMQNQLSRLKIGKNKVFEDAGVQEELNKFLQTLDAFKNRSGITTKEVGLQFDNLRTRVAQVSNEFKNVNRDGYSFGQMIEIAAKKMLIWKLAGDVVFSVLRRLSEIPDIIAKIDQSLTEINKVLDMSTSELRDLTEEATNIAIQYGRSTVEVLDSIGAFAKSGLDAQTSQQFAQLAALLSNVGDISTEVAQKTLIMANAGYQLGNDYKTLNQLISQFNELANKNAIEVETLAEAWQNSASIAKQAGLSIEDYNALITVAGSVSQKSGSEIGNAIKTFLMRLQGVSDGVDTLEDDVSKVDEVLSSLGIQIKKSPTEFRPAMEVIAEIAQKYKELGEAGQTVQQSQMLEALAGKHRANIVAGILDNFDQINKALEDQVNAFGSAERENARYMESIQAKTKALQAQWELFASHTLSSDLIKWIIDLGTAIVKLLDSGFGRFVGTVGLLSAAIIGLQKGFVAFTKSTFATQVGVIALDVAEKGLLATTKALTSTLLASPLFWVVAGTTAIYGIIKLVDALTVSVEEQRKKVEILTDEYSSLKNQLEELKNVKNPTQEQSEYISLLERELEIKQELLRIEQKRLMEKDVFGKGVWGKGLSKEIKENLDSIEMFKSAIETTQADLQHIMNTWTDEELKKYSDDDRLLEHLKNLKEQTLELESSLIEQRKTLQGYADALGDEVPKELQELINDIDNALPQLQQMNGTLNETNESANNAADGINNIGQAAQRTKEEQEELNKVFNDAIESFQDVTDKIQSLYKIQNELNKSGKITADVMDEIISKHPELIGYLGDREALENKISEAIANQEKVQTQAYNNMLENSRIYFNEQIRGNTELFNKLKIAYGKDAENFKTLAEAKNATDKLLVRIIGTRWSDLYGSQEEALQAIIDMAPRAIKMAMSEEQRQQIYEDVRAAKSHLTVLRAIKQQMQETVKDIDFKSINLSPISSSKSTKKTVQEVYKPVIDRYYEINNLIEQINQKLERNSLLLEQADNPSKIKYLRERIDLYKQLTSAYETLNKEQGKEREETRQLLRNKGFVFDALGNIVNYATQLKKFSGDTAKNIEELIDRYNELNNKIIDTNSQIISNQNQIRQHIETIKQTMYEIVDSAMSPYEKLVTIQQNNISLLGEIDTEEEARKHVEYLKSISKAYEQQMSAIESSILKAKQELASLKDSSMIESVNALISYLEDKKIKLQIDYIANQDAIYNAEKRANETKLNVIKNVESKIIDMLRKRYEEERDLINKNHELQIQRLNEQKRAYEEIINQKLQELEQIEDQESYEKQLTELLEERANLQRQHDILLMDSSLESAVQREELLEQLSQKDKEIAELQHKRSLELRKRNLQDALEKHNKEIDDKIDKYEEENKKYNEMIDERLKMDNLYVEARKALESGYFRDIEGHLVNLTDALITYENQWGEGLSILGDTIKSELIDNLIEAQNALLQLNDLLRDISNQEGYIPKLPNLSNVNNTPKEVQDLLDNIKQTPSQKTNDKTSGSTTPPQQNVPKVSTIAQTLKRGSRGNDVLTLQKALNQILGVGLVEDGIFGAKTEAAVRLFQQRQKIRVDGIVGPQTKGQFKILGYNEGGLVDYTGLALVHGTKQKPEAFLDNEDRLLIKNLTDSLKFNPTNFLPKFNLKPIIPSLAGVGNVSIQLDNLINIEGNADSNVIPRLKQEGQNILENLKKELSKRGVTFRVR